MLPASTPLLYPNQFRTWHRPSPTTSLVPAGPRCKLAVFPVLVEGAGCKRLREPPVLVKLAALLSCSSGLGRVPLSGAALLDRSRQALPTSLGIQSAHVLGFPSLPPTPLSKTRLSHPCLDLPSISASREAVTQVLGSPHIIDSYTFPSLTGVG